MKNLILPIFCVLLSVSATVYAFASIHKMHEKRISEDINDEWLSNSIFKYLSRKDTLTNFERDTFYFSNSATSDFQGTATVSVKYDSIAGVPKFDVMVYEWGLQEKAWLQDVPTIHAPKQYSAAHDVYGNSFMVIVAGRSTQKTGYRVTFTAQRK